MSSRRAADALIAAGGVRVNGTLPPPQGILIDPQVDQVTVDGRPVVPPTRRRYLALNKPPGLLVTARDTASRPTVFDLLDDEIRHGGRLFSVGRLDMATSGLLLLTDDGDLAYQVAHPSHGVEKEYLALVRGLPGAGDLRRLRAGVELADGRTAPALAEVVATKPDGRAEVRLTLREGRNREVRRMLEAIGHPVLGLRRTGVGPIRLGRLKEGAWRRLRPEEVKALREAAS